ncbi:M20 family metallopeptidase [Clostridium polynesiense]|uniref:M20 family metallopeptidase n=1 Tax=Clostridium polynesiense TaxID=1325933 RepID=UPI00058E93C4|nr:M20 family metallopeptidase [Clostridium polynesiense]
MDLKDIKEECDLYLEDRMDELWSLSKYIYNNPELAFEEYKACDAQCSFLEKNGFKVTKGMKNLPTAFIATYKQGTGKPVIAILSEYDALPMGHACGHNIIATSAMGSAIETKMGMEKSKMDGTLVVIGTPAEESGGGKIIQLSQGVYDEVDCFILTHPTTLPTRLAGECMSSIRFSIEFLGKSAHASSHPHQGANALSAANMYFVGTGLLRQHFKGDLRLSGIIKDGGRQTGMIPEYVKIEGSISCFNDKELEMALEKVKACAEGSAIAMGCQCNFDYKPGYKGRIPNTILAEICRKELLELGEPVREGMPFDYGGEDAGDVSRVIPICNPYITLFPDYKISGHTEEFKALADSEAAYRAIKVGSKAMARTALELYNNPKAIMDAKDELKKRLAKEEYPV